MTAHRCHWPGCGRDVSQKLWGCKEHFYRLPARLRALISRTYAPGQDETKTPSAAYLEVAREVQRWIAQSTR